MGCRPSKAANAAAAMCMRSETDSDYIAQAKEVNRNGWAHRSGSKNAGLHRNAH